MGRPVVARTAAPCLHIRLKIISCAQIGRMEEARKWRERLLEIQPGATIAAYKAHSSVFFHPEALAVFVAGLREAGLPEE